ncbi:MAG TPA: hypothetical protein VJN93_09305 [Candidatus Acidoferrum sp.]|nr:hypothetical protein [Candidatus Acidoferrum sp.]
MTKPRALSDGNMWRNYTTQTVPPFAAPNARSPSYSASEPPPAASGRHERQFVAEILLALLFSPR